MVSPETASKWFWLVVQTERQDYNSGFSRCYRGKILDEDKMPHRYVRVGYFKFALTSFEKKFGRGSLVEGIEMEEFIVV